MQTKRILIVDDSPDLAHMIQDSLAVISPAYETTVFLSGEEAWLDALKTRYDLVITDLGLPGISGTELVRRLRSRYPDIKLIAISGLEEAGLNERTRAAGVDAFYRKPVEIPLLLTKIDNLLEEPDLEERIETRSVLTPKPKKPDTPLNVSSEDKPYTIKPTDLSTMKELERRLLQLMQECGADGVILSSDIGNVLVSLGSAENFFPDPGVIEAFSALKTAVKRGGLQEKDANSLGLSILPGIKNDLIVAGLSNFYFWLLFPTGNVSVESGKAVAAWNALKGNLLYLLNLVSHLPSPRNPHPPKIKEEPRPSSDRVIPEEDGRPRVDTGKLPKDRLQKEEVDSYWDSVEPEKKNAGVSPDAISFDQASNLGLIPKD
jgi:CheY-like chemotaxis protein